MDTQKLDEIFREARKHEIVFKPRRVQSLFFGDWDSTYAGDGMEFEELREYVPGENPRRIYRRASIEAGKPIIVKRLEQRETRVAVILDLSRSMFLREKMEAACSALTIITASALEQRLPCGIFFAGENHVAELLPKMGDRQMNRIKNTLRQAIASEVENIKAAVRPRKKKIALRTWSSSLPKGSYVFVISDFLGKPERNLVSALEERRHGYKVLPVIVQDELEYSFPSDFPARGVCVTLQDAEEGESKNVWIDRKKALELATSNKTRFERLTSDFKEMHLSWVLLKDADHRSVRRRLQKLLTKTRQKR